MMLLALLLLLSSTAVESRITFATSQVLDSADLGVNVATFPCNAGCRVYSPTKNANIVIVDSAGKEYKSLMDLSTLPMGQAYELQPSNAPYQLKNKGMGDPPFIFYAVEKGAANYMTKVVYVDASTDTTAISAKNDAIVTVMSSSGLVAFSEFQGDFSGALPSVYATPFDSISACKPVYTAATTATLPLTYFPVNSPVATINFKKTGAKTVSVSGNQYADSSSGKDTSAVYTSPGYVGCSSVGDSLYTLLPRVYNIDTFDMTTDTNGLALSVTGDYSIASAKDALSLTINDDMQKYSGKNSINIKKEGTSFKTVVSWTRNPQTTDGFALQIDLTSKNNGPPAPKTTPKVLPGQQSTTPASGPVGPVGSQTTPKAGGGPGAESTTTKGAEAVGIIMSSLAVIVFTSLW